jgi:hypothetical protein
VSGLAAIDADSEQLAERGDTEAALRRCLQALHAFTGDDQAPDVRQVAPVCLADVRDMAAGTFTWPGETPAPEPDAAQLPDAPWPAGADRDQAEL